MTNITITDSIKYIGVDDHTIDLFEGQYRVPDGVSYNSYLILDRKVALMDTVDRTKGDEWMARLDEALAGRTPDYLVTLHMEPDHAANIAAAMERFPSMRIVGSAKTFAMTAQFFGTDYADRRIVVAEGLNMDLPKAIQMLPTVMELGAIDMEAYFANLAMLYVFVAVGAVAVIGSELGKRRGA